MSFADELKIARENKNLTMRDVASWLRIPYRTYQNWELGLREPVEWVQKQILINIENMPKKYV